MAQSGCWGGQGRLEEEGGGGGGGGKSKVNMSLIRRKKTITNDVFDFRIFVGRHLPQSNKKKNAKKQGFPPFECDFCVFFP